MKIVGRATYRTELIGDGHHRVIGWELVGPCWTKIAEAIVDRAQRDGLRKLPWFWKHTGRLGWDKDERAWWVLTGLWREIKFGCDLREVF